MAAEVSSAPAGAPASRVRSVDGAGLRDLLNAGLAWLESHHAIVNALNVFPVPDGDTGTNMLLTMRSACREVTDASTRSVGAVAKAAAQGALMGARGNSGVILSQILRGISHSLDDLPILTGQGFASALTEGSRVAYMGVNRPVEGTILTVVRETAAAAESAAELEDDLGFVVGRALHAAADAVANTPMLLPVLAQAGKVDSGGKGFFYLLEGIYRRLHGELGEAEVAAAAAAVAPSRPAKGLRTIPPMLYGFDVQFLVEGALPLDVAAIREQITAMGDCPLVEGDEALVKVHVHVPDPGPVLSYAISLGFVTDVVVENMDDMLLDAGTPPEHDPVPPRFENAAPGGADHPAPVSAGAFEQNAPIEGPGVLAVSPGPGLADVLRSLGAHAVILGGQTMNPSTQDLLEGIHQLTTTEVIILPNNGNIIMAAGQAQALAAAEGRTVAVVPSTSIPQGINALLSLNSQSGLARNVEAMTAALSNVRTGEVTTAIQNARFDGIEVQAGDIIGLLDDRLTAKGPDAPSVVQALLEQMDARACEIITLYYGEPVSADQAAALRQALADRYPDQEIETLYGGQPFYHYLISAE